MSRHHDTNQLDNAVAYIILRTARRLRFNLDKSLSDYGADVSPEQWFILFRLWERSGVPQNTLTDPVLNDEPNIARHVQSLEALGYVERVTDADDRRRRLVSLTAAGRTFMSGIFPFIVETREAVFAGLSPEELETLVALLLRVEANIS